jgi:ATP-dependent Clp protease protease subunit
VLLRIAGIMMTVHLICLPGVPVVLADDVPEAGAEKKEEPKTEAEIELEKMSAELKRLKTEYELLMQRQKNSLQEVDLNKQAIESRVALQNAKQEESLASLRAEVARLEVEAAKQQALQKQQIAEMEATIQQRATARKLQEADLEDQLTKLRAQSKQLAAQNALQEAELKKQQSRVEAIKQRIAAEVAEIEGELELRDTRDKVLDRVVNDIQYRKDPLVGDTLYVSDRRISLNGPIIRGTARYVCERIDFFNNLSKELPIFIVIDNSPGGSVMEGYRIVKAIETSPAPVHVVVKSFAASMAAVITTLADQSYAYPNAIILHHQMSSGMFGNLTEQAEQLEVAREWERRLAHPVAEKMGVSLKQFVTMMYENNSNGDWEEFADKAQELKWVGQIVQEIREDGVRKRPEGSQWEGFPFIFFEAEEVDAEGNRFVRLPRLQPFDYYFMYNPDRYYR